MRLGVVVRRRFAVLSGSKNREAVVEATRAIEVAIPPMPGLVLAFADGPEVIISKVRHRVGTAGLGVLPVEIELIACKEPLANLEGALAAGWCRIDEPLATPPAVQGSR